MPKKLMIRCNKHHISFPAGMACAKCANEFPSNTERKIAAQEQAAAYRDRIANPKPIKAWETPGNDDSAYFAVGKSAYIFGKSTWTVGEIDTEAYCERVHIKDTAGVVRVSLPSQACGLEYPESGGEDGV